MNNEKAKAFQEELLKVLYVHLKFSGNMTERSSYEMNDITDILTFEYNSGVNNDPVLAQHYFLPQDVDNVRVNNLVQSLTIRDDLNTSEKKQKALQLVNLLNFKNPFGVFVLDPDYEILSYRNLISIYEEIPKESCARFLIGSVSLGFGVLSKYIAEINSYIDGKIDWNTFMKLVVAK